MDDIFKPVVAMLHLRDSPFEIIMEIENGTYNIKANEKVEQNWTKKSLKYQYLFIDAI